MNAEHIFRQMQLQILCHVIAFLCHWYNFFVFSTICFVIKMFEIGEIWSTIEDLALFIRLCVFNQGVEVT